MLWASAFAAAFAVIFLAPATGDGFTRGLNRVAGFLGWQAAAAVLALAVWTIGNGFERGTPGRRVSRVPAALSGLLAAGILALVIGAVVAQPDPSPTPAPIPPVTTPSTG